MQVYTALSVLCCRDGGRDMLVIPRGGQTPVQAKIVVLSLTLLKSTKNANPPAWRVAS